MSKYLIIGLIDTKNRIVATEHHGEKAGHRWVCQAVATEGPKFVRSGNGRPLIALHCLLLTLVKTPLRIEIRYCFGFPLSGSV